MLKAGTSHCVIAIHATLEASNGTIEATNKSQPINPKGHVFDWAIDICQRQPSI
jgi:hypothetical protein